jgi:hypothetical protein
MEKYRKFRVNINSRKYFLVYLWTDKKFMFDYYQHTLNPTQKKAIAFYDGSFHGIQNHPANGKRSVLQTEKTSKSLIGTIHFSKNWINAVVIYHECCHAILDYFYKKCGTKWISVINKSGDSGYKIPDFIQNLKWLYESDSKEELFCDLVAKLSVTVDSKLKSLIYNYFDKEGLELNKKELGTVPINEKLGRKIKCVLHY